VSAKEVRDEGVIAKENVFWKEEGKYGVVRMATKCLGHVSRYSVSR
jgi:hypothetical protein